MATDRTSIGVPRGSRSPARTPERPALADDTPAVTYVITDEHTGEQVEVSRDEWDRHQRRGRVTPAETPEAAVHWDDSQWTRGDRW
jgi:hypothetical protein